MKIKIGIPFANYSNVSDITKESLSKLTSDTYDIKYIQGSNIFRARNVMINNGLSNEIYQDNFDFDYFLSVDSDVGFTEDNINQLIETKQDVVGGIYQYKDQRHLAVAGMFNNGNITSRGDWDNTNVHKVDWTGSGFLLVHKNALKKLEYPWFRTEIVKLEMNGKILQELCSDDIGFGLNCKRCGVQIYIDCDCKVVHDDN